MALDKEADVEVNQEVDKEVANFVDEFCHHVGRCICVQISLQFLVFHPGNAMSKKTVSLQRRTTRLAASAPRGR